MVLEIRVVEFPDKMANDPNIPLYGRTLIWNIIGRLDMSSHTALI